MTIDERIPRTRPGATPDAWPTAPTGARLCVWFDRPGPGRPLAGSLGSTVPPVVLEPSPAAPGSRWDLTPFGCAHRVTAIAFTPDEEWTSVTLFESPEDAAGGAEYRVTRHGLLDLYAVGWAHRAGAFTFNR